MGRRPKAERSGQNVQPACGQTDVSDCQDVCSSLAPPAVQKRVSFCLLVELQAIQIEGQLHTKNRNTNRHTSLDIMLFFLGSHKHSPTHGGQFIAAQSGRS